MDHLAAELIELTTHQNFAQWLALGAVYRGWARSALGDPTEGLAWIEDGIEDWRAPGSIRLMPFFLALKAEALHLADRTSEALKAISEAEALADESEERWWCAELYRLCGVFLTPLGAEEAQIEDSFCEAIRIANEQKSVSLENVLKQPTRNIAAKSERVGRTWNPTASLITAFGGPPRQPD